MISKDKKMKKRHVLISQTNENYICRKLKKRQYIPDCFSFVSGKKTNQIKFHV